LRVAEQPQTGSGGNRLVLAAMQAVRVVATPAGTRVADRYGSLHGAIMTSALASVAAIALLGNATGFAFVFAAAVTLAFISAPVLPLTDAYALKGLAERGRSYGPVRVPRCFAPNENACSTCSQSAPEGSRAAAQGDIAMAHNLMMAAASALAGALYGASGSLTYAAMTAMAATGGGLAFLAARFLRADVSAPKG
jgi:MFS family permease